MPRNSRLHLVWFGIALIALLTGIWVGRSDDEESGTLPNAKSANRPANGSEKRQRDPSHDALSGVVSRGNELNRLTRRAFNTSDPVESAIAFARLLENLTPENAVDIEKEFAGTTQQRSTFRYAWGAIDGQAATDYALENLGGEILGRFLLDMLPGWGSGDPSSAMAWFDGPGPEAVADSVRQSGVDFARFGTMLEGQRSQFIRGIADHDIDLATDYAYRTTHEGDLGDTLEAIAPKAVRQRGGAGAGAWAESLPDGPHKGVAMEGVARAFVHDDPSGAARWVEDFGDESWAERAVGIIRRELAAHDVPAE